MPCSCVTSSLARPKRQDFPDFSKLLRFVKVSKDLSSLGVHLEDHPVRIAINTDAPLPESALFRHGDRILSVNGESVVGSSCEELLKLLKACDTAEVTLQLFAPSIEPNAAATTCDTLPAGLAAAAPPPCVPSDGATAASEVPESIRDADDWGFVPQEGTVTCPLCTVQATEDTLADGEAAADAGEGSAAMEELSEAFDDVGIGPPQLCAHHRGDRLDHDAETARLKEWIGFMMSCNAQLQGRMFVLPSEPAVNFYQDPHLSLEASDDVLWMLTNGVPHPLRAQVWLRFSGAPLVRAKCPLRYDEIQFCSAQLTGHTEMARQDLERTYPYNVFFNSIDAEGTIRLKRVLFAFGWMHPAIGYCQGLNLLAAMLLLFMEEEDTFWTMCGLVKNRVPAGYYTVDLEALLVDQRVLRRLVAKNVPRLDRVLVEHNIELSLITVNWFLTAFAGVVPECTLVRLWDCFMLEGSQFLFKAALAMLTLRATSIQTLSDPCAIFQALARVPQCMNDPDNLLRLSFSFMHIEQDIAVIRAEEQTGVEADRDSLQRRRANMSQEERSPQPSRWSAWLRRTMGAMRTRNDRLLTPATSRGGDSKPANIEQTEKLQHLEEAVERLRAEEDSDKMTTNVTSLVRGPLCEALHEIFAMGYIGRATHGRLPHFWDFIEEVAASDLAKSLASVPDLSDDASELVKALGDMCATVDHINDAPPPLPSKDSKFDSFICRAISMGSLHVWFSLLALAVAAKGEANKWFDKRSFLGSPAWRQIRQQLALIGKRVVDGSFEIELQGDKK